MSRLQGFSNARWRKTQLKLAIRQLVKEYLHLTDKGASRSLSEWEQRRLTALPGEFEQLFATSQTLPTVFPEIGRGV